MNGLANLAAGLALVLAGAAVLAAFAGAGPLLRLYRRIRGRDTTRHADAYQQQLDLLHKLADPALRGNSAVRASLLRELAAAEAATAQRHSKAGEDALRLAAEWSAYLLGQAAIAESGHAEAQNPAIDRYLRDLADADTLTDRGYACARLRLAVLPEIGERATAALQSVARIYFELGGAAPERAAALADGRPIRGD